MLMLIEISVVPVIDLDGELKTPLLLIDPMRRHDQRSQCANRRSGDYTQSGRVVLRMHGQIKTAAHAY